MRKTAVAVTLISALLITAAARTQLICIISANFIPETPPPGIRINSDGTVEGTNLLNRVGNVYTLIGDIYDTIVVFRDDIVLDGAGYTLHGKGSSTGVFLQDRSNVTIKNLNIRGFYWGIKSIIGDFPPATPKYIIISGNTITQNTYGIVLASSAGCMVLENRIINNTIGASMYSGNVFRNNRFDNNEYALDDYSGANDLDSSNTVNGKPIYYWFDQHDKTVPLDAGLVILKNCSGITVEDLKLEGNGNGLLLYGTTHSTIRSNILANNKEGISLKESSSNTLSGNRITSNKGYGIYGYHSTSNVISKNQITLNEKGGVNLDYSVSNIITENDIAENYGNGVFLTDIKDSDITNNNVTLSRGCGIGFGYGPNGKVKGNVVSKNDVGIWMSNAFENTVTFNNVTENFGWAVYLEGDQKNNTIHHNNFIGNKIVAGLQVHIKMVWSYPGLNYRGPPSEAPLPELVPGAGNYWDDGREGNYWSDYTGKDANSDGIGDTPYLINEKNADNFPLMLPFTMTIASPEGEDSTGADIGSFPVVPVVAAASAAVAVVAGAGLLVYFKKRNHAGIKKHSEIEQSSTLYSKRARLFLNSFGRVARVAGLTCQAYLDHILDRRGRLCAHKQPS
jgi:parallel beta-helix repeat protein